MPKIKTEDLIRYLYRESSNDQTMAIEKALETDWELKDQLDVLKDSMKSLDKMVKSPRPQSVEAILNYARSSMQVEQP